MTEGRRSEDEWDATWEGARKEVLKATLAATPAERLAWLEEFLELAYRVGAIEKKAPGKKS